jgi:2-amino-4-hydroxy-6-hydroxymethyldihydropteridine diphosphokinase
LNETDDIEVREKSPIYETDPVGDPDQPKYLNAAVRVETGLDAKKLLGACLGIEKEMGRIRHKRWDSRIIDIDLLVYENLVMSTKDLTLPHPLLHERAFVLRPLADIAPDLEHPVIFDTIRRLLEEVDDSGVQKVDDLELNV